MRILLLIVAVFMLASFKEPQSCEQFSRDGDTNYLVIFPLCGDSSLYIVRKFDRKNYIHETVFKNKKEHSWTSLYFESFGKKHSAEKISCDEFFYQDGDLTEVRSHVRPNYIVTRKSFLIDTDFSFEINYYPNGFIRNYNVQNSDCQRWNGAELDSMNTYIWRGRYDGIRRYDTTTIVDKITKKSTVIVKHIFSKKIGTWTKTDFSGKVLETIKYPTSAENKMQKK